MTDSFGFSNRDPAQYANRIEPIKEDLESSNDPEDLMLMIICVSSRGLDVDYECEQSDYGPALYGLRPRLAER